MLGRTLTIQCFFMLKITFIQRWLIKINMTFVYVKPKIKKWHIRYDYSYKWSFYRLFRWKLLSDMGMNDTFDCRRCKGSFSRGASEYVFDCWLRFSPIIRISHKGLGDNMALFWETILLETVLILYVRDLVPTSFFKWIIIV